MEFNDVIRKRRMVRSFLPDRLDPDVVDRLLRAANRAPSAGFSQGNALLVLESPDERGLFWDTLGEDAACDEAVAEAPLIVIPFSNKEMYLDRYARADKGWTDRDESRWPVPFWHIDTGFMVMLTLLAAVDEELGALYFGITPPTIDPVRKAFGVPDDFVPIGAVAIGRPRPQGDAALPASPKTIKRRTLDDVVHRGAW